MRLRRISRLPRALAGGLLGGFLGALVATSARAQGQARTPELAQPPRPADQCPTSPDGYQRLLEDVVRRLNAIALEEARPCFLRAPRATQACFDNVSRYLRASRLFSSATLPGSDPYVEGGQMRRGVLPQTLFEGGRLRPDWRARLERCRETGFAGECQELKDVQAAAFRSTIMGPGQSHDRVVIQIPGPEFDRYFLDVRGSDLDLILVPRSPTTAEGRRQARFYSISSNGRAQPAPVCTQCHPNGLREIVPTPGSVPRGDLESLAEVNRRVRAAGAMDLDYIAPVAHLGPPPGRNQGCVACHSDDRVSARSRNPLQHQVGRFFAHLLELKMGPAEFSMPTQLHGFAARDYAESMAAVDRLSDADRATVASWFQDAEGVGAVQPRQAEMNARLRILGLLRDRGLIDEAKRARAEEQLRSLAPRMSEMAREISRDHEEELRLWLLGGSDRCAHEATGAARGAAGPRGARPPAEPQGAGDQP